MPTPRWHAVAATLGTAAAAAALVAASALASRETAPPPYDVATGGLTGAADGAVDAAFVGPTAGPPRTIGPVVDDAASAATADARAVAPGADLFEISADTDHDVPRTARAAYVAAARAVNRESPDCRLPWELVAGIGRVETDHGRYGGSQLGVDGVSRPLIRGLALDGVGPVAEIRDTDGGRLDGDEVWDRAVGPMQFIPSTWRTSGRDGDGDGRRDPDDLHDAALATAAYLCPASGTILDESVMRAQVFSYNHSDYYVDLVIAFAVGYHTGVFDLPPPPVEPAEEPTDATSSATPSATPSRAPSRTPTREPARTPTRAPEPTRTPTRTPTPTREPTRTPSPTRTPTPSPTPTPTPTPSLPAAPVPSAATGSAGPT